MFDDAHPGVKSYFAFVFLQVWFGTAKWYVEFMAMRAVNYSFFFYVVWAYCRCHCIRLIIL